MPEKNRPNLSEVTQRYATANRLAGMKFGEEGKSLREEERNIYSEAVDLAARTLLGNKGKNGKELLEKTAGEMFISAGSTLGQEIDLFSAVAVRIAEIASEPQ